MIDKRTENKAVKESIKGFIEIIEDPITKEVANHLHPYKKPTTEDEWRELAIKQSTEINELYNELIEKTNAENVPALARIMGGVIKEYMPNPDIAEIMKAKYEVGQDLMERFNVLNSIDESSFVWSKPFPMFLHGKQKRYEVPVPSKEGVYKIIHKPTNKVMSIGFGSSIASRFGMHRIVFKNRGKCVLSKNSYSGSQTATHMYQYDRRKSNWLCQFLLTDNLDIAIKYEVELQKKYKPEFNSIHMAGK